MRHWKASLLSLFALASGACKSGDIPGLGEEGGGVDISFSTPDNGDEIASSSVKVKVRTNGISLAQDAIGGAHEDGKGHYHYYLDGNAAGESAENSFLVTDLVPGDHEISARLFYNDHQPIQGASPASVNVTVPPTAPRVSIVTPDSGSLVNSSSVELTIEWENYASGRWQAYVDTLEGDPRGVASDPKSVVTGLAPGKHRVFVRLHHSDGEALDPEVLDVVDVEIPEGAPAIRIIDPTYGATVPRDIPLSVEVSNFDLDGNHSGGENVVGQGHYHVYIDGYDSGHMWKEGLWPSTTVTGVAVGVREVYVRLMNNDHTSIEPKVVDRVEVQVSE